MTKLSKQKTFYAKCFEEPIRQFFKCPSKTKSKKPYPYFFIQNKDNATHVFRTKDNGMADIYAKSIVDSSCIEERFLTFFPYKNKKTGGFTIGRHHWENFKKAVNKSNEKNNWGVFCIDKDNFILVDNTSRFISHDITITVEQYDFEAVEIFPQDGIYFQFVHRTKYGEEWSIITNGKEVRSVPDNNYKPILPAESYCHPLPKIAKEHLFLIKDRSFTQSTIPEVANTYHGTLSVDAFSRKLRRNLERNIQCISSGLRMRSVDDFIIVIPDDFEEEDFIEWQKTHLKNKTDSENYDRDRIRQWRQLKNNV